MTKPISPNNYPRAKVQMLVSRIAATAQEHDVPNATELTRAEGVRVEGTVMQRIGD